MKHLFLSRSLSLIMAGVLSAWAACVGAEHQEASQTPKPAQEQQRGSQEAREELPADIICADDYHPTLWEGKVNSFKRGKGQTEIAIRADWDADYSAVISHPGSDDPPLELFRLNGKPFKQSDWKLIEVAKDQLMPDMRAKVWVCMDKAGKNPIVKRVDWLGVSTKRSKATP